MKNLLKKLSVILIIISFVSVMFPLNVSADGFTGRTNCESILGLTPWDCNVSIHNEDTLKSGIWQIVANIANDIAVIAAYLVLGYVIYGGYLYIFSGGEPGKVTAGKKTLIQAFIGLAIVMSVNIIMSTIRIALIGSSGAFSNCASGECIDPTTMVESVIGWFIGIAGFVAAIFLVYGGILYITSSGDAQKLKKAKDTILYSLIGLAIVGLSVAITAFVSHMIREANQTSLINETIISKEVYENKIN